MPALNATSRSRPEPSDVQTFWGSPTRETLVGPRTLYRFGTETGRWWYGQELINDLKADFIELNYGRERPRPGYGDILMPIRDGLAVSHEWNPFSWFCTLTLAGNQSLDCWTGRTYPQPAWQTKPDGQVLHGGLTQYLIYDVASLPPSLVTKRPTAHIWRQWSRNFGHFGSLVDI